MAEASDQNNQLVLLNKLDRLQSKIAAQIGRETLNYIFLFSKREELNIEIEGLTPGTEELLEEFVKIATKVLSINRIPFEIGKKSVPELYLELMRDLYLLKFISARYEYAEYQLVRVPTKLERSILNSLKVPPDQKVLPSVVSFGLPKAFIIDDLGVINIKATREEEKQDHTIKSYLSLIPEIEPLKSQLFKDFEEITMYGIVPLLYDDELNALNEKLTEICFLFFTRQIYAYIVRGIPPTQAKANVFAYYRKLTNNTDTRFPEQLANLEADVVELISTELRNFDHLDPSTKTVILEEYKELVLFMINSGDFYPVNYYEIIFRDENQFDEYEKRFNYLIDVYLLLDDGRKLPEPFETYNIDFTHEAKLQIFEAVTGGLENPRLTLVDYLSEEN